MKQTKRRQIRALVEKILRDHGVEEAPVDIEGISRSMGIDIRRSPADDSLSGFLYRDPSALTTVIGVNSNHHPNRQRFTIAHELGHYVLHVARGVHLDATNTGPQILFRENTFPEGNEAEEVEANVFASELLMPSSIIAHDLNVVGPLDLHDDRRIDEVLAVLAKKYRVSKQALTIRLAHLGFTLV